MVRVRANGCGRGVERWRAWAGVGLASALWLLARDAHARANAERERPQGFVGLGVDVGFSQPNGPLLRLGLDAVGLEVAGGYKPVLVSFRDDERPKLEFFNTAIASAEIVVRLLQPQKSLAIFLRAGGAYDSLLGPEILVGGHVEKAISERWVLRVPGGIRVAPQAAERIEERMNRSSVDFGFPPEFDWGLSVGAMYYL